jgi:hypothetical protein
MFGKHGGTLAALVLTLGLLATERATADTPFCKLWPWRQDCPTGDYCRLHYWTPGLYYLREYCRPSNLDQYPPGPCAPIAPNFLIATYRCPYASPAPSPPYADPAGYYGRPLVPATGNGAANR